MDRADKFDGGMKPDGKWERDMDTYLASWETILAPLREMGFRIIGFGPRVTFALGDDSAQVSVAIAERIVAARREAFEEAARIVGPDDALYAGPYPAEICDVIAGVLLSRAAAIRARAKEDHEQQAVEDMPDV